MVGGAWLSWRQSRKCCDNSTLWSGARRGSGLQKPSGSTWILKGEGKVVRRWRKRRRERKRDRDKEREVTFLTQGSDQWAKAALVGIQETPDSQLTRVSNIDSHRPSFQAEASFQPWNLGFTLHRLGRIDWLEVFKNEIVLSANHAESMSLVSTAAERTGCGFGSSWHRTLRTERGQGDKSENPI